MRKFTVNVRGSKIELEFIGLDASKNEQEILSVFDSVRLLIVDLLEANLAWKRLSQEEQNDRLVAHLTMGMNTQGYIAIAAEHSMNHRMVLEGKESLSNRGYPEFDGYDYLDD